MKKKSVRTILIVLALAMIAGAAYLRLRPSQVAAATTVPTATVQRSTLTATVNTAGNIQSHQSVDLTFGPSGDSATEIVSGLKEGDVVILTTTTKTTTTGGMGIPGAGGPPPGM